MRKTIVTCDCCGNEISDMDVYPVEHCVHVAPGYNRLGGHVKVVNGKSLSFSGRTEKKEFCLECYNQLFAAFFDCLVNIQNSIKNEGGNRVGL